MIAVHTADVRRLDIAIQQARRAEYVLQLQGAKLNAGWRSEHMPLIDRIERAVGLGDVEAFYAVELITKHGPKVAIDKLSRRGIDIKSSRFARNAVA